MPMNFGDATARLAQAREKLAAEEARLAEITAELDEQTVAQLAGDEGAERRLAAAAKQIEGVGARCDSLRRTVQRLSGEVAAEEARRLAQQAAARLRMAEEVTAAREAACARIDKALLALAADYADARRLGEELADLLNERLGEALFGPARLEALIRQHLGAAGLGPDHRWDKSVPPASVAAAAREAHTFHIASKRAA